LGVLAAAAFAAGLYHTVNHAVFKASFLCSGSIQVATGTRDIEKLGGLIKRMRRRPPRFSSGHGISALPPLSGLVSEWLIFQFFFVGLRDASTAESSFLPA
jgi:formate hydrogenlyase subunit 3/multisubunit Na+/H+ antiporter MnhD subunit